MEVTEGLNAAEGGYGENGTSAFYADPCGDLPEGQLCRFVPTDATADQEKHVSYYGVLTDDGKVTEIYAGSIWGYSDAMRGTVHEWKKIEDDRE